MKLEPNDFNVPVAKISLGRHVINFFRKDTVTINRNGETTAIAFDRPCNDSRPSQFYLSPPNNVPSKSVEGNEEVNYECMRG